MRPHGQNNGIPPQHAPARAHDVEPVDDNLRQAEPTWLLETSCSCPSRPAVRVVIPPGHDRPRPAELFLCGHHYRGSQEALIRAHASIYDRSGALISSGAPLR
jgi:hypothetical protein